MCGRNYHSTLNRPKVVADKTITQQQSNNVSADTHVVPTPLSDNALNPEALGHVKKMLSILKSLYNRYLYFSIKLEKKLQI